MNYLKKYLHTNNQFNRVIKDIFSSNPIIIDHLAHRTFDIDNVYKVYSDYKDLFELNEEIYNFRQHNATAEWWKCTENNFDNKYTNELYFCNPKIFGTPRIFVSRYLGLKNDDNLKNSDIDLENVQWHIDNPTEKISFNLYEKLSEHNQYLAWTLLHRENVNHIGIEVNNIKTIAERVSKICPLNNESAPIQVSEDGLLFQFSTKSTIRPYTFIEGEYDVPYNFLEFVERKDGRDGFSQKNANIVFDSTKK